MSLDTRLANAFGLRGEDAWRRHANPWSVYTRIPIPLLLVVAIWSRALIGWWALVPVGLVLAWTLMNPRVFPAPSSLERWASRSVLGETVWARRKDAPVPARHRVAPVVLSVVSALGLPFLVWGLIVLDPWITAFGLAVQMAGKLWFLDRMALLYDDVSSGAAGARPRND
ncbi:DUF6653 family protein [Mycobacterium sp.]|uniref:DUF6653 family protein n=1 Tax=Mycobacterium sp. TaxID=1785 RepID=UPI002D8A0E0E|nr:DUF6653 family protein [Mycobacterium sp.]